ncbi:hypothetical protein FRB99_004706 [Tulasnella sp. 403]|nr:hypothetical protein FRB99_004706 [Tulasnella sp. 403]
MSNSVQTPASSDDKTQTLGEAPSHQQQHQQHPGGRAREALENLERDLEETTNAAVKEGEQDVQNATSTYLEQALSMADYGIAAAQGYITQGKERLGAPHADQHPPSSFAASLISSATAALDAASQGLTHAQHNIHDKGPHIPQSHAPEPAHPVTVPAKPVTESLAESAAQAGTAAQASLSAVQAGLQPKVEAAAAGLQQQVEAAQAAVQPKVEIATTAAVDTAKSATGDEAQGQVPVTQQVEEAAQIGAGAASDAASSVAQAAKDAPTTIA